MESAVWVLAAACTGLLLLLLKVATAIWWKPLQVKKYFESQGIRGPPYRVFNGNTPDITRMINEEKCKPMPFSHDILPRVFPHYHQWSKAYGEKWAQHRRIINPAFHMDLLK
ncbi:hypothetical protein KI387_042913, partial [Taxus chinensis]